MFRKLWDDIKNSPGRIALVVLLAANVYAFMLLSFQRSAIYDHEKARLDQITDQLKRLNERVELTNIQTCPISKGSVVRLIRPFRRFEDSGFAYITHILEPITPDAPNASNSKLILCEGSRVLGPPHSPHSTIVNQGYGSYSHWITTGIIFSASDNTDPNSNGRDYFAVIPSSSPQ